MPHKTLTYIPAGDINPGDLYTSYGESPTVYTVQSVAPRGKHEVTLVLVETASKQVLARITRSHLPCDLPVAVNRLIPEVPKAPGTFQEKVQADYYTTKLPYGNKGDKVVRDAYRADVERLSQEFRRDLEYSECANNLPQNVRDTLFALAWDEGHADGHHAVANHYSTYHDLAVLAFMAGVTSKTK